MRILGALTAGAVLLGGATALAAGPPVPEADLAYHGHVALDAGRADVTLVAHNHGPSPVDDATVRLRWSTPIADAQSLPHRCTRSDAWTVLCGTGALAADGPGTTISLRVRLVGAPPEVLLEIGTAWSGGGAVDGNHLNDRQRVLALDTDDTYRF
ncbi:hypothetical protein GCM10010145_34990 [Streptomyces ruber]|uniref:DUF11 domain-containing protein n=2 Tax=Streptomyces TaxID=1883 RepID=A0A918BE53_9ACTN|nr:hypothetical protein [Streptomyces ruber]GGQ62115.1 hypothetical protein GCM10010145_34990 [Streptomyces ruber]